MVSHPFIPCKEKCDSPNLNMNTIRLVHLNEYHKYRVIELFQVITALNYISERHETFLPHSISLVQLILVAARS